MLSDTALLQAWSGGDRRAGSQLFERYYGVIYRFYVNKLASAAEIEDLMQQCFMVAVEASERFRGEGSFRAFVLGIARNILLEYLRSRTGREISPAATSLADCARGMSSVVDARREHQQLLTALRHIPLDSQVVLEMRYWEQMPIKEIALALGETVGAIRGRITKARSELRGAIDAVARELGVRGVSLEGFDDWVENMRTYWG